MDITLTTLVWFKCILAELVLFFKISFNVLNFKRKLIPLEIIYTHLTVCKQMIDC